MRKNFLIHIRKKANLFIVQCGIALETYEFALKSKIRQNLHYNWSEPNFVLGKLRFKDPKKYCKIV